MQFPFFRKSRVFRLATRVPSDRGSVALNIMIGMIVMMLVTYELAKTLSPALHTISAREDVRQSGTISNLANSYVAQTGDMQPTIAKLVANGYLSGTAKGVCASCTGAGTLTTNDGSVISLGPGSVGGVYSMTLQPGPNMSLDDNYYLSHLTGSTLNGTLIQWNQPVPAIDNLGTYFVQKNPANPSATQTVNSPLSTNGYPISNTGSITTNGSPINANGGPLYSGSLSTGSISSGQINANGNMIYSGGLNTGSITTGTVNMNAGPAINQCSGGSNTCGNGPGYQGREWYAGFYIGGQAICYVDWGAFGNTGIFLMPCV